MDRQHELAGLAPPAWREDAACREFPTDLFFPIGHGPRAQAQASHAKTICDQCPVRADCLEYSLVANAQFGVFGGLTEDERRRLRRTLGRPGRFGGPRFDRNLRLGPPANSDRQGRLEPSGPASSVPANADLKGLASRPHGLEASA